MKLLKMFFFRFVVRLFALPLLLLPFFIVNVSHQLPFPFSSSSSSSSDRSLNQFTNHLDTLQTNQTSNDTHFSHSLLRMRRENIQQTVEEDSSTVFQFFTFQITLVYFAYTLSILIVIIIFNYIVQFLSKRPIVIEEELNSSPNEAKPEPSMPIPSEAYHCFTRIRVGGWSREFNLGQDSLMCEFIEHDKKRHRMIISGNVMKTMKRTPTYLQTDQKSILMETVWRRPNPLTTPPTAVRLRLENSNALVGIFVYSIEVYFPNLNCTSTYSVYTTLFGGTIERIDATFKQTSINQNVQIKSPVYGLTIFEFAFMCYFFTCVNFLFCSFMLVSAQTNKNVEFGILFKKSFMASFISAIYTGVVCLVFAKHIRFHFVMSNGDIYWNAIRFLYLNLFSIISNIFGMIGLYRFFVQSREASNKFSLSSVELLIQLTCAWQLLWLIVGFLLNSYSSEPYRFLRARVLEKKMPLSKMKDKKKNSDDNKIESFKSDTGKEAKDQDKEYKEQKPTSLKALISKNRAENEMMKVKNESKDSLGSDYYNIVKKGKVTSISQYFQGTPKFDEKMPAPEKSTVTINTTVETESSKPVANKTLTSKTMKKSDSTASVGSTGSDYYAAMIKEGKIPKIGSISQYGALLK